VILRICGVKKGVSLMEVLVALFILSVVGAVVVGGVFVAVKGNTVSRTHILAEGLARYELEYVKSVAANNWTSITNQTYTIPSGYPTWDNLHNSLPPGYEGYTVAITISYIAEPPYNNDSNIRKVNAAVSNQGSTVISIDTYVVKP